MAEHLRDNLGIDTLLLQQRRCSMAQIMEADMWQYSLG
jgi:hypothetical protein